MTFYSIAGRVRRIKPSPSTSAADRANELRRQGKPIVKSGGRRARLRHACAYSPGAAAEAMENGATRYTLDGAERSSCGRRSLPSCSAKTALSYGLDEIIVTSGAKSAIYSAFAATRGARR